MKLREHDYILESLGWMHPKLADALRIMSPAERVFRDGFLAYRPHAETLLGTGPGIDEMLSSKLDRLDPARRVLIGDLVQALASRADADPRDIGADWAGKL